ncbi:MAG TPA: hypothetical protein VN370_09910 [Desulfitobacteriaceae bacterium]|nr:hypothetical protein [Desulfitobacteriaceae bacterium]
MAYNEPKKNVLIIVGLSGEHGRLFELAANTYKQEHSNDDVKILYAKDYKSMDELLDASSKAFDKGFWGNIFDNNEIDDLVYYGHSYSPGEGLDHGGLSVFFISGRNDSWITKNTDLSMLDFNNGATIHLYGCDGGVVGPKGENSIAQDLANKTGVIAYGYTSKSSFTSD